jgi:hypothetical protein
MADTPHTRRPDPASTPARSSGHAKDDPSWAPESGDKPDAARPEDSEPGTPQPARPQADDQGRR